MIPVLEIEALSVGFSQRGRLIQAVDQVSLQIAAGECLAIVGESGSGKTQMFMAAMGLLPSNAHASGRVRFEGVQILPASSDLKRVRGSKLTMIFQDPMSSLTPHLQIGTQLAEVMVHHNGSSWSEARSLAGRMLDRLHIPEPKRRLDEYPYQLSGGMRQRVMIAMSLLCRPSLLIADEPTTALDVTVQAQIMHLLRSVRDEFGMAMVLVSHDLSVVAGLAQRINVMYAGRIVERSSAEELFRHPRHPYTAALLKCIPSVSTPRGARMQTLAGHPPRTGEKLDPCAFAPRCPRAAERCRTERPQLTAHAASEVACHFPLDS